MRSKVIQQAQHHDREYDSNQRKPQGNPQPRQWREEARQRFRHYTQMAEAVKYAVQQLSY